jgi:hypothetical protein
MKEAGLDVHIDAAGNIVGTRAGSDPSLKPLLIGSHIDSVPMGGNYDGDVGSLSAIEVAQMLKEKQVAPKTLDAMTLDEVIAHRNAHLTEYQSGRLAKRYRNLVNQVPVTVSAANAGWLRVKVVPNVSGDLDNSLLFRKIEGTLPDATYGERMPRGKAKLSSTLREIIRLWIEGGAPGDDTWVPGTF